ncbi:unnamed protein product [Cylicostephanus goldi]|uniref:SXP/RAL-2 family protein Ani s 5-like cation-binding domain-containing protein n=1 Tax=Cylicostephanus goldi TaxID=71465 RepID=A0A3P7PLD4_CYLGO|nr:unnamed protein product [Cylicostephanus goldi]
MAQWAEEYGFTKQYEAYKKLIEEQKLAAEREFDEAVQNLPFIVGELRQIEDDKNLTALQSFQKEMEIINRLTPKQQQLLKCSGHIFAPAYLQPRPGPNGPGVFRPGPFVPGPYGPSPFRPGPYGPGPNGPGPYGPGPYGPGPYGPDPYGPGPRGPGPYPRPRPGPHGPGPWGPRGPRGF